MPVLHDGGIRYPHRISTSTNSHDRACRARGLTIEREQLELEVVDAVDRDGRFRVRVEVLEHLVDDVLDVAPGGAVGEVLRVELSRQIDIQQKKNTLGTR